MRSTTSRMTVRWLAAWLTSLIVSVPAVAAEPSRLERWLFNSAERTERAVESFERGDVAAAVDALEIALRLAAGDPRAQVNAGVGRLAAERDDALPLLETAAGAAVGELVPVARYNLGNARMAGGDLEGAIEAYQQALRADPDHQDAKYNLELARRRFEASQSPEESPEEDQEPPPPRPEQAPAAPPEAPQDQPSQQQPQEDPPPDPRPEEGGEEPPQSQRQSPLPQFRDLPDMNAEEAAAILQAVENMEREGRRREAAEAARQNRPGKKDW